MIENENLIFEGYLDVDEPHSVKLMMLIDSMIKSSDVTLSSVDVFSCTIGPGSFTGQRIGISTILGFADALNKPVVGISSLQALSYDIAINCRMVICPILDARNDFIYTALYQYKNDSANANYSNNVISVKSDHVINIEIWLEFLKKNYNQLIFVGECNKFQARIKNIFSTSLCLEKNINAVSVARLAQNQAPYPARQLRPIYLRKSQADNNFS